MTVSKPTVGHFTAMNFLGPYFQFLPKEKAAKVARLMAAINRRPSFRAGYHYIPAALHSHSE